ncbi:MAG: ribonuclease D [Nitrospira sp.]|nr:ribonuclease D [Nitrospira sp.]
MAQPGPHYIADPDALQALCARLREHPRFALDTEFVGEDSFVPRLELIQVAVGDVSAVIDFPAIGSLGDFAALLNDPGIEKVVHAGRQDLELFYAHTGQLPASVFDTQMAAAMVGYGTQVAYAQLVQRIVGARLDKSHTLSNWSQRPLSAEQIAYALDDVTYLLQVHEHLHQRLRSLGRLDWAQEEFRRLEAKLMEASSEAGLRYQRIRGWDGLKPKSAAVLRELVHWREGEARRRNVPRGRVVRDEVLLELARRQPATPSALRATRGLHASEAEKRGEAILAAIQAGLALPPSEWPEIPRERKPEPEAAGLVELLQAVLKACALEAEIAPSLLASAADLQQLAEAKGNREQVDVPVLQGWRRTLAGETLLNVLDGRTAVLVDGRKGRLTLKPESKGDA